MARTKTEQAIENEVIQLYKQGMDKREIASQLKISYATVRNILISAGDWIPKKRLNTMENGAAKCVSAQKEQELMDDAVTKRDIALARALIRVGTNMNIKTDKASYLGGHEDKGNGCIRKAIVVDTSDHIFCRVQLVVNGVKEDIQWSDIWVAIRDNAPYVGWRKKA